MPDDSPTPDSDRAPEPHLPRWPFAVGSVLMGLAIFSVMLWNVELPYLAWSPGPTPEVVDLLTVSGAEQYPVEGDLYMLTVSQQDLNVYELLAAVADPQVFPDIGIWHPLAPGMYEALEGAEALVICTEWHEFRRPDWDEMNRRLKRRLIFDGRKLYKPARMAEMGYDYYSVGRPHRSPEIVS